MTIPLTTRPVAVDYEAAFSDLYGRAYRVAFRLLGSRADAEEVAQEAMARAFERWPRLTRRGRPDAWVARVSANLAIDTWRHRQRVTGDESGASFERAAHDPATAERLALVRSLRSLSSRQREVVVLRYLADLSESDVADALRCSAGSVKQHASRGLARLRAELGEEET